MAAIMRFELRDDEWKRIAQYSNLPAEARPLVEEAIALFRTFEASDGRLREGLGICEVRPMGGCREGQRPKPSSEGLSGKD